MEKQIIKLKVDFDFNWIYEGEIKKLKEDLDALEKLGATEIEIEIKDDWGGVPYVSIEAFTYRIETAEEYKERMAKENQRKEEIKRQELELLGKLKAKYEM